ncbi:hypothetical protein ABDK00_006775 [Niabella insulamsoli]|uniref:hypothetical protein n=1 Tax=Niabella insulamsoli TaxID=3144874 RepID=UPI0031FC13C6
MINTKNVGNAFDGAAQQRYDNWQNEYRQFAEYLKKNTATATMVATALSIYRPNACRYKRWLEDAGQLWEVRRGVCAVTGFPAKYLSTNPDLKPANPQRELFTDQEAASQ